MLTPYIVKAMEMAHYEPLENNEGYFGEISGFSGLWARGFTLESCRSELQSALEDWIMVGISLGHEMPVIDGISLIVKKSA